MHNYAEKYILVLQKVGLTSSNPVLCHELVLQTVNCWSLSKRTANTNI